MNASKPPMPVQRLQRVCNDIKDNSIRVDGKMYWSRKFGQLPGHDNQYMWGFASTVSILVKGGVLKRELVR